MVGLRSEARVGGVPEVEVGGADTLRQAPERSPAGLLVTHHMFV